MKTKFYKILGSILFLNFLFVFAEMPVFSQTQNVGIGTTSPDNSAILDLVASDRGFLVPRLTTAQRDAISSPATGLLIYNLNSQRFEYYDGTQWVGLSSSSGVNAWSLSGNALSGSEFLGSTNNQPLRLRVNNNQVLQFNTNGSIQRDGGGNTRGANAIDLQYIRSSATQVASGSYATISGGGFNTASGEYSTVGGGEGNTVSSFYSFVGGGGGNTVSSFYSFVGGGLNNSASGGFSFVGGGRENTVSSDYSFVGGGVSNTVSGDYSFVGGGASNYVSGELSFVGGGVDNYVSSFYSFVGGGENNYVSGEYSTVGGGKENTTSQKYSTVAGGSQNTASGEYSTVGGGKENTTSQKYSTVAGGSQNTASGEYSTVGGGKENTTSQKYSTVAGGSQNTASGEYSTVAGGEESFATGWYSFAVGYRNQAYGDHSVAMGRYARTHNGSGTKYNGSFAFGDSSTTSYVQPNANNQFVARFAGGYRLFTNSAMTQGVAIYNNGVGIGITSPSAFLHQDQGSSTATYHKFTAGTTTGTSSGDGFDIGIDANGNAKLIQNENSPMIFATNSQERMRIFSNGKVGINTSSIIDDSILVQSNGDVYIDGDLIVTGTIDPKIIFYQPQYTPPSTNLPGATLFDGNSQSLQVRTNSGWDTLVTNNSVQNTIQSVAWKTTGNANLNPNNYFIGTTDNFGLKIKTNNTDRIYITENGRVGVGTLQPKATLEVNGSISRKVSIVTTNLNLDETYHTILVNSSNNVTITLPTANSLNTGVEYVIKNINSGIVTISGSIDGASSNLNLRQRESVELVSNGSTWVVTNSFQPVPPIGSIIAWHKNMNGTPSLPYGWVECNGQTLNDPASPYHNQTIPNLNGDINGANSPGLTEKVGMFLRGGTTSGNGQNDAFQGHYHSVTHDAGDKDLARNPRSQGLDLRRGNYYLERTRISVEDPTSDGTNGTPRTANETRPKNMSVVWIMRVK